MKNDFDEVVKDVMENFGSNSKPPRNPDRIDPFIQQLTAFWKRHPDLRLGQIITCCCPTGADLFYVEDDMLRDGLNKLDATVTNYKPIKRCERHNVELEEDFEHLYCPLCDEEYKEEELRRLF